MTIQLEKPTRGKKPLISSLAPCLFPTRTMLRKFVSLFQKFRQILSTKFPIDVVIVCTLVNTKLFDYHFEHLHFVAKHQLICFPSNEQTDLSVLKLVKFCVPQVQYKVVRFSLRYINTPSGQITFEVKFIERKAASQQNEKVRKIIQPFVTTYHPALLNLKNILMSKQH